MESVINWVLANIEIGRIPTAIRVCEPYASALIAQSVVSSSIISDCNVGEEHLICLTDNQNMEWKATLCV